MPMLCMMRLTENQSESINARVSSRCPRILFCGIYRFVIYTCGDAVIKYNNSVKKRQGTLSQGI